MGTGNAFLGITHEVVQQSTTNAFGTLSSGWTPTEGVQFFLNGALAGTFAANATGHVAVGINTGAGFGFITIEQFGTISGKRTGGVCQVSATGPYLSGNVSAPHAVNTSAGGSFLWYGFGYRPNATVNLYRNAVSHWHGGYECRRPILRQHHSR